MLIQEEEGQIINIQATTAEDPFISYSFEELRWLDYIEFNFIGQRMSRSPSTPLSAAITNEESVQQQPDRQISQGTFNLSFGSMNHIVTNWLNSITAMDEYSSVSFEELRLMDNFSNYMNSLSADERNDQNATNRYISSSLASYEPRLVILASNDDANVEMSNEEEGSSEGFINNTFNTNSHSSHNDNNDGDGSDYDSNDDDGSEESTFLVDTQITLQSITAMFQHNSVSFEELRLMDYMRRQRNALSTQQITSSALAPYVPSRYTYSNQEFTVHSIVAMNEYSSVSFEELRLMDYMESAGIDVSIIYRSPPVTLQELPETQFTPVLFIEPTRVPAYRASSNREDDIVLLQSITGMEAYTHVSFEELRLMDYMSSDTPFTYNITSMSHPYEVTNIVDSDGNNRYSVTLYSVSAIDIFQGVSIEELRLNDYNAGIVGITSRLEHFRPTSYDDNLQRNPPRPAFSDYSRLEGFGGEEGYMLSQEILESFQRTSRKGIGILSAASKDPPKSIAASAA